MVDILKDNNHNWCYLSLHSSHFLHLKFINQRINKNKYPNINNIIGNKIINIDKYPIPLIRL